jgi:predicted regulator of Ras-like GTPase activity (Roadblock/LC7/MglB family)
MSDPKLEDLLQSLTQNNPDLVAVMVVDPSGRVNASQAVAPEVGRAAVALAVPARDLLDRVSAELGCGTLRSVLLEGDLATLAFADIDGASTAVLVGATGAAPGALRADALAFVGRLQESARVS